MRKGKDPDPVPYLCLMDSDPQHCFELLMKEKMVNDRKWQGQPTIFKNWYLPIQATYKLIISCGTHTTMLSEQSKRTFKFVSPKLFIIFILFFRKLNLCLKETHRAICIFFNSNPVIEMNQRKAVLSLQLLLGGMVYADDTMVSTPYYQLRKLCSLKFKNHNFISVLRIRDVYPGSRILIFTHPGSWISDPGSKNSNKREK